MSTLDSVPADQTWTLTRDLPHEVGLVYRAFLDPEALPHWYGPSGWSVIPDSIELEPSACGIRSFTMVVDEDPTQETPVHGCHGEIVPERLLEIHEYLPDHLGRPSEHMVTLCCQFDPLAVPGSTRDNPIHRVTRITLTQGPLPEEVHDHARAAWVSSLDRLSRYLTSLERQ